MKQKNNSSEPLTKTALKQELGALETRMDNKFITKDYLQKSFLSFAQAIRNEIRFGFEQMWDRLEQRLTKHTSLILTTIDPLLKELETRRQDREIASDQSIKVEKKLDNHEKRIEKLEYAQQATLKL
jgi:hypothetical protein